MRSYLILTTAGLLFGSALAFADPATVPSPSEVPTPAASPMPPVAPTPVLPTPAVVAPATPTYTMIMKYVPSTDLKYSTTISGSASFKQDGKPQSFTALMTIVSDQIVKSVDTSGNGTMRGKIDSMKMSVSANGTSVPIPMTQKDIDKMSSNGTITMSPRGTFLSVDPGTKMTSSDAQQMQTIEPVIAGFLSELAVLPDHAVSPLDTWRGGLNLAQYGLVISMKMTLNDVKVVDGKNMGDIAVKLFVTAAPPASATQGMSQSDNFSLQLSGLGNMVFDIDDGYAQGFNMDLTATAKSIPIHHKIKHIASASIAPQQGSMTLHIQTDLVNPTTPQGTTDSGLELAPKAVVTPAVQ